MGHYVIRINTGAGKNVQGLGLVMHDVTSSLKEVVSESCAHCSQRTMAKLITVFGATGAQGNYIVSALLQSGFKVRAVTRNPDSEKAKALKNAGADPVKGDLNDAASIAAAVQGVYGVFLVTDFWGLFQQNQETAFDIEIAQGKSVADACKKAGVKHVVYSGLDPVKDAIGIDCPHFESKAIVEKYMDEIGVPNTSVRYPFYYDNFIGMMPPQKQDDGTFAITLPADAPMYAISVADGGPAVASVFSDPGEYIGKKIGIAGDKLKLEEYATIMSKVSGKTVKFNQVPPEVFAKFPFPGADDIAAMFQFFNSGKMERDITLTRRLNPKTQDFEQYATENKEKFEKVLS